MKTADLYIRVSTDEQAEKGYSQRQQLEQLQKYCNDKGIKVLNIYTEDYSAKTFNRPEIKKMMVNLKKTSKRPNYMLFTKWDRFSRNVGGAYEMIAKLDMFGIEPQAIEQPLDMTVPENQLMLAIYLAAPMTENLRRSKNVFGGMRKAKKEGRYMGSAPIGYKNAVNEEGKKCIVPAEQAALVRWAFNELSEGQKDAATVRNECHKKGLKLSKAAFYILIRNPVYCGNLVIPAYKDEEEIVVKGLHEPLISEALFDEVQDILNKRTKKKGYRICAKPELPLRGFLNCPRCGNLLTGSASTSGNGTKHWYYHCKNGCKERVMADKLNNAFTEKLTDFVFTDEAEKLYQKIIENLFGTTHIEDTLHQNKISSEIEKYEAKLSNMREKLSNNEISSQDYKDFKNDINPILLELKGKNIELGDIESELKKYLKKGMQLIKNIGRTYVYAQLDEKQKIIRSIFKENIVFQENTIRTGKLNDVVTLIASNSKASKGFKKKTEGDLDLQSCEVLPPGIEPGTY